MSLESNIQIVVNRKFPESAERIFDAWLDPVLIGQWMFGPALRDEEIVRLTVDARVGGAFSFLVRRQGQEIDHVGIYRKMDRPNRLAFTWGVAGHSDSNESLVTIEMDPQPSGCELTLTHQMDSKWSEYADRTQAGWTKMVDMLASILKTND